MAEFDYTGKTPVIRGDRIVLLDEDGKPRAEGKVKDALATQCVCNVDGKHVFLPYDTFGIEWDEADQLETLL